MSDSYKRPCANCDHRHGGCEKHCKFMGGYSKKKSFKPSRKVDRYEDSFDEDIGSKRRKNK